MEREIAQYVHHEGSIERERERESASDIYTIFHIMNSVVFVLLRLCRLYEWCSSTCVTDCYVTSWNFANHAKLICIIANYITSTVNASYYRYVT